MDQDPVVATGGGAAWRAWLRQLLTAARARLAGRRPSSSAPWRSARGAGALRGPADEVTEGETAAVDQGVAAALRGTATPSLERAARLVSALGSELVAVLLVALVGYFARRRRWGAAASLVLVTVGAQLLNTVLNDHFRRPRPAPLTGLIPAQAWSFPSGHAMVAAAFYLFLAYVGWRLLRGPAAWRGPALLVALVLLIDVVPAHLSAHYLTDVVAGNAVGLAWTAAVVGAGNLLALRRARPRPPPPPPAGRRASRRIPLPLHAPRAVDAPPSPDPPIPHRGHHLCHPPGFPDQTLLVLRQSKPLAPAWGGRLHAGLPPGPRFPEFPYSQPAALVLGGVLRCGCSGRRGRRRDDHDDAASGGGQGSVGARPSASATPEGARAPRLPAFIADLCVMCHGQAVRCGGLLDVVAGADAHPGRSAPPATRPPHPRGRAPFPPGRSIPVARRRLPSL